ncbi:cytidylyltransferase domain-containing protein [Lysinibacillus sphaericus]|uniref:acylneuraminate cytidylyltransferase family protein n=1 Tax=Lysinibacillus sphaericus TaxID=1421 RepID=UPI003D7FEB22
MKPKILAVIPARGGSKGITRKNIRNLAGKPLIAWTIEKAQKSKYISRLILSSDDDEIIEVAKKYGCDVPFKRPKELAQDDTPGIEPVIHSVQYMSDEEYDYVVLLQPTSPLCTVEDIDGCIELALKENSDFVVTVTESDKSPYWMYKISNTGYMQPLIEQESLVTRRQALPKAYSLNGAVYVGKVDKLLKERTFLTSKTKAFSMPSERSFDIDSEIDFMICEQILINKKKVD